MKVYLVAKSDINLEELLSFYKDIQYTPPVRDLISVAPTDEIPEIAGRLCYMSYGRGRKTNEDFIRNILSATHGSVLEHVTFSFIITGVSRSLTHELVRHRHLSFSQLSQRYVDETDSKTIIPDVIKEDKDLNDTLTRATKTSKTAYSVLVSGLELRFRDILNTTLRRKMARQAARAALPNSTETKIFVSGNARAWRHFIEVRGTQHADVEIRSLALAIYSKLKEVSPNIFGDYRIEITDGIEEIKTDFRKV